MMAFFIYSLTSKDPWQDLLGYLTEQASNFQIRST